MILDRFRLDGKVAIVTGAGKGIGAGTARRSPKRAPTSCAPPRTPADVEAVAADVRALGRRALAVPTDVTEADQRARLVERTVGELGGVDVLVNNAGGWNPRPFLETSEKALEAAFRFNVTSAFSLTKLAVPHLHARGTGSVINISSRAASMVQPCFTAYAAAKAALSMMTRAMAPELAPRIRVNAIEVGGVETDALANVLTDPSVREQLESNTPMHRVGQPDDIAACIVYLASDAASWVTGKVFEVDGGVEAPAFTVPFDPI